MSSAARWQLSAKIDRSLRTELFVVETWRSAENRKVSSFCHLTGEAEHHHWAAADGVVVNYTTTKRPVWQMWRVQQLFWTATVGFKTFPSVLMSLTCCCWQIKSCDQHKQLHIFRFPKEAGGAEVTKSYICTEIQFITELPNDEVDCWCMKTSSWS